ncbi:MAG TPA: hypothetical protein VN374_06235 [Desulfitobacteriaceae bacterium]|nr:hypothetical protein [Desulfitobacteriaceae bacterium]
MLTDRMIIEEIFLSSSYHNGCVYFKRGYVKNLSYDEKNNIFQAQVKGSKNYHVSVEFYGDGDIDDYNCTCPAYYSKSP